MVEILLSGKERVEVLELADVKLMSSEEVEALYRAKTKVLFPDGVATKEARASSRCVLIHELGILEHVLPMQVVVADPPPTKEEIHAAKQREKEWQSVHDINYLAKLDRPLGRRSSHRHPC